jgi:hypothetical protein
MSDEPYFVTIVTVNGTIDSAYECDQQADAFVEARNKKAADDELHARRQSRIIPKRHWAAETVRLYRRTDERP